MKISGKGKKPRPAREVEFINNEPEKEIPGGITRESTLVSEREYPEVARRRRLNGILLNHCQSENVQALLGPKDEMLLQRISQEAVTCGTNPVIRQKAIWALRLFPTVNTINVLIELAELGEDEYIRSYAIGSLGALGLRAALPIFVKGLKDRSGLINNASKRAIGDTVKKTGTNALLPLLRYERSPRIKETIKELMQVKPEDKRIQPRVKRRIAKPDQ